MDLTKLSDEELNALEQQDSGPDLSHLSDAELDALERDPSMTESAIRGAAQGATFGFADEIAGGLEAAFTDKSYEQARDESRANFKRAKDANPKTYLAGEVGGGIGTVMIPGLGAANAVRTLGGAAKVGSLMGAASGLGHSEAKDAQGQAIDMFAGMGTGALAGAGGHALGQGIQKGANFVTQKAAPLASKMMPIGKKDNAAEIEAAAKALGIKATPGMTNASETVQKLESSLHQAPTIGGWLTRRSTEPAIKGLRDTTDDLISDAATASPWESGERAKQILSDSVNARFKPSKDLFEDLAQYTKDIPSTPTSTKAVSRNILKIPEVEVFDLPAARQVVKALEKNPSADQIKQLRGMIGKKASSAQDASEASALWQMYAKLGKLEENTIKRGVISSARTKPEGNTIAAGMLNQLRDAKKGWSTQLNQLDDFSTSARLGDVKSPSQFVEKINSIPSERLQEKLLPLEDARLAQNLKTQFPEAFNALKGARIRDLSEGVVRDGEALPGKLLQNTKGLNPEAVDMLFGAKAPKLDALKTAYQALPDKVGPSGTQQAFDIAGMLNPMNQARDLGRYGIYKAASSEHLAKVAAFLKSQPKFANMAENNPRAFQAAVYQFAQKTAPYAEGALDNVAKQFDPKERMDDKDARDAFLEY